jgi:antitoxin component HigA of HigAB toxin-antitoxin module
MASATPPSLRNEQDFDRALSEVEQLLGAPPAADSVEDRWFSHLLNQIADYHEAQPPAAREANADRLLELDRHLRAYGRRWRTSPGPDGEDHWSPLLGGDIDPRHHRP